MDLIRAADNGNIERVRELLDSGVDSNITNNDGETSLIYASREGHIEIVQLLLDRGADPKIRTNYGDTALISASYEGHTDIVELLLKNGADPNIDNDGYTALWWASHDHIDIVRLLLDHGANPNIRNIDGVTALIEASGEGHIDIVQLLLDHGADPDIRDNYGKTALIQASNNSHTDIVKLIRDHIDLQRAKQNLAFATIFNPRLGYDIPINEIDYNAITDIISNPIRSYNPSLNLRMKDEERRDKLTKAKQRSTIMRGMETSTGPFSARGVRYDPNIMENIGRHLSTMRPNTIAQRNMREEIINSQIADYLDTLNQYGSGKRSGKRSKRSKRKKRSNRYI